MIRKNNNSLWSLDRRGQLTFPLKNMLLAVRSKSESFWTHPVFMIFTIIVCLIIDYVCFEQLFGSFLHESASIRNLSVGAMLFAFDAVPVYLGLNMRRRMQGYRVHKYVLTGLISCFALAFAANVMLRITMKDLALPDLTTVSFSLSGNDTAGSAASARAMVYAIFAAVMPLLTSAGSFFISYTMADPLRDELKRLDSEYYQLSDAVGQIEAVLQEYESDPEFAERLMNDDDEKYEAALQLIREKAETYRDYVRERIKEHLGDPADNSELSKQRIQIEKGDIEIEK